MGLEKIPLESERCAIWKKIERKKNRLKAQHNELVPTTVLHKNSSYLTL